MSQDADYVDVSNREFLNAIFGDAAKTAMVSAFADPPDKSRTREEALRDWSASPAGNKKRGWPKWKPELGAANLNTYFTISTFEPQEEDGRTKYRRRKALYKACHVVVIDDVGDTSQEDAAERGIKVDRGVLDMLYALDPSYELETSPGNCQWGLRLDPPEPRRWAVEQLVDGMIAKGLTQDGTDPGMQGVTRNVRLPQGVNNKIKHTARNGGEIWRVRMRSWHPERTFTVDELANMFGIELIEPGTAVDRAAPADRPTPTDDARLEAMIDAGLIHSTDPNNPYKHYMVCFNAGEHSDRADEPEAVYFAAGNVDEAGNYYPHGGYKCHHGHCEKLGIKDLETWLMEEGHYSPPGRRSPEEAFAHLDLTPDGRLEPRAAHDEVKEDLDAWPEGHPRDQAELFIATRCRRDGNLVLRYHQGQFYRHEAVRYRAIEPEDLGEDISAWAVRYRFRPVGTDSQGRPKPLQRAKVNTRTVNEIRSQLGGMLLVPEGVTQPSWLPPYTEDDPDPIECIPCLNGLLHAPTRRLLPATPRFWSVNAVDYAYDPVARCPQWEAFVEQVFGHDPTAVETLQEIMGYLLTQDTSLQKMFFILGKRRSGKGTIARVITALLGAHNVISPTLASLVRSDFGLQQLIGRQAAIFADAAFTGSRKDQVEVVEHLKRISGEDWISINRKNKDYWSGRLTTRLLLMANGMPTLSDNSHAFAGRAIILQTGQSFYGREDPCLTDRLLTELPGVMNWALEGLARLRARAPAPHFRQPESGEQALQALRDVTSPISVFVREVLETGSTEEYKIPVKRCYALWERWCTENGHPPGSKQQLSNNLDEYLDSIYTRRVGPRDSQIWHYVGIREANPDRAFSDIAMEMDQHATPGTAKSDLLN